MTPKRKRGRPTRTGEPTKRITLRFSTSELAILKVRAHTADAQNLSDFLRELCLSRIDE
jgi:hypothetical protein